MDIPRSYTIRESSHRIHNAFSSGKLAALGQALSPSPGTRMLDLACGSGEMLCAWARDHQVTGTGVDLSTVFIAAARARAAELGRRTSPTCLMHGGAEGPVSVRVTAEDPRAELRTCKASRIAPQALKPRHGHVGACGETIAIGAVHTPIIARAALDGTPALASANPAGVPFRCLTGRRRPSDRVQ